MPKNNSFHAQQGESELILLSLILAMLFISTVFGFG
jgi:hypothetical protein